MNTKNKCQIQRYFDFKEGKLTDLGLHPDVFEADASVRGGSHWLVSEWDLIAYNQFIEQALAQESQKEHPEWFALTTNDELKSIGHFESFDDADDACTYPTHWIFDEAGLRSFQVHILNALGDSDPEYQIYLTDAARNGLPLKTYEEWHETHYGFHS
jgi:hypothetical protein